jgi:glycogen(starch) synthase
MRLLVVTNLYPPQELGGYGRAIADFVWGLMQRGHRLQVLTSDAPYLQPQTTTPLSSSSGPNAEPVARELRLKGSYQGGVQILQDPQACASVDQANATVLRRWLSFGWDGVLVGNLDLLGPELLPELLGPAIPVVHHVGFVTAPFPPQHLPNAPNYTLVAASAAVRQSLVAQGFSVAQAPVVYPGARTELFGQAATGRPSALAVMQARLAVGHRLGSPANPLRLGFAGLLMGSKGAHTVVQALVALHRQGWCVQANFAGANYQDGYQQQMQALLSGAGLADLVQFVGQLDRARLARFWSLHHVGVFASTFPEAFGIVAAEVMASGVALITSGVGGAAELIEPGISGLRFEPGNPSSLTAALHQALADPAGLVRLAAAGQRRVQAHFSVQAAAQQLEQLF